MTVIQVQAVRIKRWKNHKTFFITPAKWFAKMIFRLNEDFHKSWELGLNNLCSERSKLTYYFHLNGTKFGDLLAKIDDFFNSGWQSSTSTLRRIKGEISILIFEKKHKKSIMPHVCTLWMIQIFSPVRLRHFLSLINV